MYTMEYYSAIKKNETVSFAEVWMDVQGHTDSYTVIQSKLSQKEENKYHILTYMWNLEKC